MKKGGGSKKGSAFEREVCVLLSNWWTDGKDDSCFWRCHSSGARATIRHKAGKSLKSQVGDIAAVDGIGRKFCQCFTVSIKRGYKGVSLQDILDKLENCKEPQIITWIKECLEHSNQAGSIAWMLVVRRDRKKTIVFFPGYITGYMETVDRKKLNTLKLKVDIIAKLEKKGRIISITVTTLDNFLTVFNRRNVKTMVIHNQT